MIAAGRTSIVVVATLAALVVAGGAPGAERAGDAPGTKRITVDRGGTSVETVVLDPVQIDGREVGAGSVIVRFKDGSSPSEQAEAHRAAGATETQEMGLPRAFTVEVRPGDETRALEAYRARADVAYAELDGIVKADYTPNDTRFGELWGMPKIKAPQAWDVTKSSSAVEIAVLDCGIYSSSSTFPGPDGFGHIDVRSKVVLEMNFTTSPNGVDDFCNHGTHVAGTAAASTNNGIGVAGVGHNAVILNGKVLGDDGSGLYSWVANGIVWAADQSVHVINMSLGADQACPSIMQDAINYAWARGAVVVVAAGNSNLTPPSDLSRCANTVSVAATTTTDTKASFSNYGLDVDVAAPGVGILSSDFVGLYDSFNGTSMATPHVAGLAALVWTSGTASTNAQVVNRITSTAVPIAGTGSLWTHGLVDAQAAVGTGSSPINWAAQNSVDFDADHLTDFGLYRGLSPADSLWFAPGTVAGAFQIYFGATTDIPVPGDYDGDGKTDAVIYRPSTGLWYGPRTGAAQIVIQMTLGQAGDIPIPGDYDGDGDTDPAIYRPSSGLFFGTDRTGSSVLLNTTFGAPGDVPVPRDYDGDGETDPGIYRADATPEHYGLWYAPLSSGGVHQIYFGAPGDVPVPGDYDGDRKADSVIFRPSTGLWYGPRTGAAQIVIQINFGQAGDVPIPGYYDANLATDPAIYRPSTGLWFSVLSGGGTRSLSGLGTASDKAIQKRPALAGGV